MLLHLLLGCSIAGIWPSTAGFSAATAAAPPDHEQAAANAAGGGPHLEAYYQFLLGRYLESERDIEGAIAAHRQAVAIDPASAEVRAELAALFARRNRLAEAIEWAEAATGLDPGNVEANRVLGLAHARLARLDDEGAAGEAGTEAHADQAIEHLETVRRKSTGWDPGLDLLLGRLYLRSGDAQSAITSLRRVVDQEPGEAEPIAVLAQAYGQAGRTADALTLLEAASGRHPEFHASLGELYERERRWRDASAAYERALARSPRDTGLMTRLALSLLSQGGTAEAGRAAVVLEAARTESPADTQVLYLLTQAQRATGRLDEAEATAKQLAAVAPASLTGPYALAQIYEQTQRYRPVVETLEPVLARPRPAGRNESETTPLLLTLASAYQELGEFDKALAALARARAASPGNLSIPLYELGVLVAAKRFAEAVPRADALAGERHGDQRVVRLRAEALRGAGRSVEAAALLDEAVRARPEDVTGYLALSESHAASGRYDEAVRVLNDAAGRFPSNLDVRFQIGSVRERQKRFAEAEQAFRAVLSKDPLHAPALNYLGYMMADRGQRLDEAVALISRALQVEPYNGAYRDSLGWAYFRLGRLDLAEESLRKAADQRPRDSAIQDHYGDLLLKLGRREAAVDAWQRAIDGDGEQIDRRALERKIQLAGRKAGRQ